MEGKRNRQARRAWVGWVLGGLLLTTAGSSWAEDPKQEAKALYTTAQSHYNLNEFQEALQDFKEAYRLYPDPVFLFNVAQCERQLGDQEEAIKFYRSYLRNKPKAPNKQEVLRRIDELQAVLDGKKSNEKPPQELAPPAALPPPATAVAPAASPATALAPATVPAPVSSPTAMPAPALAPVPPAAPPVVPAVEEPRADLVSQTPGPEPTSSPAFYQRGWFWTAAAVVVAGIVVGVYVATSRGGNSAPGSKLGTQPVF